MPPDLEAPPMHYAYKRRVLLYKGLITPEEFIDEDDIRARMVDQEDRFTLEIATLLFGLYMYYVYGEQHPYRLPHNKYAKTVCH